MLLTLKYYCNINASRLFLLFILFHRNYIIYNVIFKKHKST